jgi:hypothetical protein
MFPVIYFATYCRHLHTFFELYLYNASCYLTLEGICNGEVENDGGTELSEEEMAILLGCLEHLVGGDTKLAATRPAAKVRFDVDVETLRTRTQATKQNQRAPIKMVSGRVWSPGIYLALRLLGKTLDVAWERAFICFSLLINNLRLLSYTWAQRAFSALGTVLCCFNIIMFKSVLPLQGVSWAVFPLAEFPVA